jgi:hypothetical protein
LSTAASGSATHVGAGGALLVADPDGAGLWDADALPDGAGVVADLAGFAEDVAGVAEDVVGAAFGAFSGWWPASFAAAGVLAEADDVVDADPDVDALGDADPEPGEAAGPGVVDPGTADPAGAFGAQAVGAVGATSPRKFRTAGWPSSATSVPVPPGIETTIWSLPSTTTVAWVTPLPLTRSSMIALAWFIADSDGVLPSGARAVKVICLPPTRSMPSFGVCFSPGQNASPYRRTKIAPRARK